MCLSGVWFKPTLSVQKLHKGTCQSPISISVCIFVLDWGCMRVTLSPFWWSSSLLGEMRQFIIPCVKEEGSTCFPLSLSRPTVELPLLLTIAAALTARNQGVSKPLHSTIWLLLLLYTIILWSKMGLAGECRETNQDKYRTLKITPLLSPAHLTALSEFDYWKYCFGCCRIIMTIDFICVVGNSRQKALELHVFTYLLVFA